MISYLKLMNLPERLQKLKSKKLSWKIVIDLNNVNIALRDTLCWMEWKTSNLD